MKKSGIFDRRRDFYDCSINNSSIWKVMPMPSRHYTEYNTLRDSALHTHTQHWSINWNRGAIEWYSTWYAIPLCDEIIVCTISRMLRAVRSVECCAHSCIASESCRIFRWDQSVHLRTQQRVSAETSGLRDGKKADFIRNWWMKKFGIGGLKNPDKPIFL